MRVLAVDPGEKNLGIALSDPGGVIAGPLAVLKHVSRPADAAAIIRLAEEHQVGRIVIGQVLDEDNSPTEQSRRAHRLASAIKSVCRIPVVMWDESDSTQAARQAAIAMGVPRRKRSGHLDELAATVILQTYLDAHSKMRGDEAPTA